MGHYSRRLVSHSRFSKVICLVLLSHQSRPRVSPRLVLCPTWSSFLHAPQLMSASRLSGPSATLLATNRELVLSCGALLLLLQLVQKPENTYSMTRITANTLFKICGKQPPPDQSLVYQVLPTFAMLLSSLDNDIVTDVCCAISNITGGVENIQAVVESGVVRRIIELLASPSSTRSVQISTLRAVGNIVAGSDAQV